MHVASVYVLAAGAFWYAWRNVRELFVAWYSGAEPPLARGRIVWVICQILLAAAAAVLAIATL